MDAGVCTDILIVQHSRPVRRDWYPKAPLTLVKPFNKRLAQTFCAEMDVMLFFETPFDWSLIPYCRTVGTKTVLMPMYECMPERLPEVPDKIICPSLLDQQYYTGVADSEFIPVPVDGVKWRRRETALKFVHNAGHGGLKGRNGTAEFIKAVALCKQPVQAIVRSQNPLDGLPKNDRLEVQIGTVPHDELWRTGDVFVFPECFNGLSLPLQEAYASGMLVMCGNRFPMNTWLPTEPLIPMSGIVRERIGGCNEYDRAVFAPEVIAATMDKWYGQSIGEFSERGFEWYRTMRWEALKHRYMEALAC